MEIVNYMNTLGTTAVASVILLLSILIVGATAASIISGSTTDGETISEEEIEEMLEDTLDEITTYLQIKDKIGKYYGEPHNQKIEKIAIMISPLITKEIDLSELTIKIDNGENIKILSYAGNAQNIGSNPLFEHPIWSNLSENTYAYIVTHDKDESLINYDTLNSNTDMAYVIIPLPDSFAMKKGEDMTVTLFPETGIQKTVFLEVLDLPIKKVISL